MHGMCFAVPRTRWRRRPRLVARHRRRRPTTQCRCPLYRGVPTVILTLVPCPLGQSVWCARGRTWVRCQRRGPRKRDGGRAPRLRFSYRTHEVELFALLRLVDDVRVLAPFAIAREAPGGELPDVHVAVVVPILVNQPQGVHIDDVEEADARAHGDRLVFEGGSGPLQLPGRVVDVARASVSSQRRRRALPRGRPRLRVLPPSPSC